MLGPDKLYRLSLVDNDTHDVVKVMLISKIRATLIIIASVIGIILAIYCIIAFTPLRSTIPGYPDAHSKKVALANAIKIDSLENIITRWDIYAATLSGVLTGEETADFDEIIRNADVQYLSDKSKEELASRDSLLSEIVHKEERFGVGREGSRSLPVEGMHFFTPVKGVISTAFDRVDHQGVDLNAPAGSIVSAVLDGTVVYSGWSDSDRYTVIVLHNDNVMSIYGNVSSIKCEAGDIISAGTPLAVADGSVFFGLWHNGGPLDPTKFISF